MKATISRKCMRNVLICSVIFYLVIFCAWLAWGEEYGYTPPETSPAEHEWVFTKREVKEILIDYVKAKGYKVPSTGKSWLWNRLSSDGHIMVLKIEEVEP